MGVSVGAFVGVWLGVGVKVSEGVFVGIWLGVGVKVSEGVLVGVGGCGVVVGETSPPAPLPVGEGRIAAPVGASVGALVGVFANVDVVRIATSSPGSKSPGITTLAANTPITTSATAPTSAATQKTGLRFRPGARAAPVSADAERMTGVGAKSLCGRCETRGGWTITICPATA